MSSLDPHGQQLGYLPFELREIIPLSLPQEIIYCILDHCKRDLSTLKASRLVSRDWYPSATPLLFAKLLIRNHKSSPRDISHFLDFLREGPTVAKHVKVLFVGDGEVEVSTCFQVVSLLTNIQELAFQYARLNGTVRHSFVDPGSPPPPKLQLLGFDSCSFIESPDPWITLTSFITAFSSIDLLGLDELVCLTSGPPSRANQGHLAPGSSPSLPTNQHKTKVNWMLYKAKPVYYPTENLTECILQAVDMANITSLVLEPRSIERINEFQMILNSAENLKSMRIDIAGADLHNLSLAPCKNLTIIEFASTIQTSTFRGSNSTVNTRDCLWQSLSSVRGMLTSLPKFPISSPSTPGIPCAHPLSRVHFTVRAQDGIFSHGEEWKTLLEEFQWSELEACLPEGRFPNLKLLEIAFSYGKRSQINVVHEMVDVVEGVLKQVPRRYKVKVKGEHACDVDSDDSGDSDKGH